MRVKGISVVVPCFNEEECLPEFCRRAQDLAARFPTRHFEFLFVDDGSTDRTAALLDSLAAADPRVKVLHLACNRGHQIAILAGLDYASEDMVVTIDADLQDPPETIGSMIEEIEAGADIVHAQRRRREGETWGKLAAARLFYRLMRCFSGTPIIPNCGDFRALTRPVVEVLISFRALHLFHRGRVAQLGFRQSVISYDRDRRHAGKTKYPFLKMVNLAIDAILGFSAIPIRVISWTSIILWSISLIYVGKALIERFVFHVTVPGWTSIVILQFFFTGLILFCTAIVGSYVGRLFLQSQQPLLYWLRDTKNFDPSFVDHRGRSVREVELSRRAVTRNRRQTADPFPRAPPT